MCGFLENFVSTDIYAGIAFKYMFIDLPVFCTCDIGTMRPKKSLWTWNNATQFELLLSLIRIRSRPLSEEQREGRKRSSKGKSWCAVAS